MPRPPVKVHHRSGWERLRARIIRGETAAAARLVESGVTTAGLVHDAVHSGVCDVVTLVLENGGDPNERNLADETPLMVASHQGRADLVAVLLGGRADPEAVSASGATALKHAEAWPHVEELLDAANGPGRASPKILRPTGSLARKLSG